MNHDDSGNPMPLHRALAEAHATLDIEALRQITAEQVAVGPLPRLAADEAPLARAVRELHRMLDGLVLGLMLEEARARDGALSGTPEYAAEMRQFAPVSPAMGNAILWTALRLAPEATEARLRVHGIANRNIPRPARRMDSLGPTPGQAG